MEPTAVVGDIHGEVKRLRRLLDNDGMDGRRLVFVGDYVNRGPSSRMVLEFLLDLQATYPKGVVLLEGNHDAAFRRVLDGGPLAPLLAMGGAATVTSYLPDVTGDVSDALRSAVPIAHRRLLHNLQRTWATDGVTVQHSLGVSTYGELQLPPDDHLLVVGHYVQHDRLPHIVDRVAYVDTGCGTLQDGPLTALLLPERTWVSH